MSNEFKWRASFVILVSACVIAASVIFWMARLILLLLFAGLIGAMILTIATNWTQKWLKLRRSLAFATVVVLLASCLGLGIWTRGPALAQQFNDLQIDLPTAAHAILMRLQT